jgi:glycosyltransferase involved in cell wall biosynthesis
MKVLFFSSVSINIDSIDIKGTGNWVISLINALDKFATNIEIYVAYHSPDIETLKYVKRDSITFVLIPDRSRQSKIGKLLDNWLLNDIYKNSLADYLLAINRIKPDIIQIFGLETPYIRIFGHTEIPIIIHIQGLLAPYSYKYYSRFSNIELLMGTSVVSLIKGYIPIFHKIKMKKHLLMEKSIYNHIENYFGRTDWDRFVSRAISPNSNYYYCQELLRDIFYKTKWKPKNNKIFTIFTTTSESFYKNVDIIFEATKILNQLNGDFEFEWKVAGVQEDDKSVKIMEKKGFFSLNIKLLGKLDSESLIDEMINSDIFVFPSAIENSPNALQEAMIIGMPIIATYAGGVSSIIEHDKTGILVPEGEPYSLAGAIYEASMSTQSCKKLGDEARKIALYRNNPEVVVNSIVNSYSKIIN